MKKILSFAACAAIVCLVLAGCEKDNGQQGESVTKELSPSEQKAKIQEVCQNALSLVDSEDYRSSLELGNYFIDQGFLDYEITEEDEKFANDIINMADVLTIPDFYATFEADMATETWKLVSKGGSAIVLKFPDAKKKTCSLTLSASGSSYGCEIEDDLSIKLPNKVEFNLSGPNKAGIRGSITLGFKSGLALDINVEAVIAEAMGFTINAAAGATGVNGGFTIGKGDTEAISGTFTSNFNLPVITDGEDIEDYLSSLRLSERFTVEYVMDLYRSMQVKGSVNMIVSEKIDELDGQNLSGKEYAKKMASLLNRYVDANVYYNSDTVQANLVFEPYCHTYNDGYGDDEYYGVEPLLYFPSDKTSYALDDFFNEKDFSALIKSMDNLISSFENLFSSIVK